MKHSLVGRISESPNSTALVDVSFPVSLLGLLSDSRKLQLTQKETAEFPGETTNELPEAFSWLLIEKEYCSS